MAATRIVSQDIRDGTITSADLSGSIDVTKLADGSISNTEFQQLNNVASQVVGISDANTLTNKIITGNSNTVAAGYLASSTGGVINITGNSPTSGQQLIATGPTAATWQTPAGGLSSTNFVYNEVPSGTVNGVNATFTLTNNPVAGSVCVYKNGIRQLSGAGNDFTLAGATITFLAGNIPQTNDNLLSDYLK